MKKCITCKQILPESDFYIHRRRGHKTGLSSNCRTCIKNYNASHYVKIREVPAYRKRVKEYGTQWHLKNREVRNRLAAERDYNLRTRCIQHYGGTCACCNESRYEFLSIDHIAGGGNKHRKGIGNKTWRWLIKNNFPPGFRILCHNCNQSLGYNGYCPHDRERIAL
jgi:hypothetical protein